MHKCTHEVKPNCDYCKQVEDNKHIYSLHAQELVEFGQTINPL